MPEQGREELSSAWRTDLDAMLRTGTVSVLKRYSIFSRRLVPGRASSQTWIMAAATLGLLILYPLFAAQIFFTYWTIGQEDIAANWQAAKPKVMLDVPMTIPEHLSGYETRGRDDSRIVFGLSLADILKNIDADTGPSFDVNGMSQQITLTFFRPDQSTFGLSTFFNLYGQYLQPDKKVGDNGLTTQHFVREGPFDNEVLYYETGYNRDRYFVRCFEGNAKQRLATCFRKFEITDKLALRYSFDKRLLGNWVGLEAAITALAIRMIQGPVPASDTR